MADELDKAVDLVRQLLEDDGAKEKLSGMVDNLISPTENHDNSSDYSVENLFSALLDEKNNEQSPTFDLSTVLSSGLLKNLFSGTNDRRITLLRALKPCLSEKRSTRIDSAITVMQIVGMSSAIGLEKLFK